MSLWIFIILGATAALFLIKIVYVLAVAVSVATTQGALYVSTSRRRIHAVLETLPLEGVHVLMDLGCGDGRILLAARRYFKGRAIGYEINPLAYFKARLFCAMRDVDIRYQNFWNEAVDDADAILCYLFPDVMADLAAKLKAEAKSGALVVSFNFPIPEFTPVQILRPEGCRINDPVYVYRLAGNGPYAGRQPSSHW